MCSPVCAAVSYHTSLTFSVSFIHERLMVNEASNAFDRQLSLSTKDLKMILRLYPSSLRMLTGCPASSPFGATRSPAGASTSVPDSEFELKIAHPMQNYNSILVDPLAFQVK